MAVRIIEIEDTSDCGTCQRRDREQWELMGEAKVVDLGTIHCQECGREVVVLSAQ